MSKNSKKVGKKNKKSKKVETIVSIDGKTPVSVRRRSLDLSSPPTPTAERLLAESSDALARVEFYNSSHLDWRWRVTAGNNEIVSSGEDYTRREDAVRGFKSADDAMHTARLKLFMEEAGSVEPEVKTNE